MLGVPSGGARALAVSTVTVQVIGKGTVTSSPAGINCGNGAKTCSLAFSAGGTTTLTATDVSGWSFDAWTGCPAAAVGNTCDIPVDGNVFEVTASFTGPPATTSTLSVTSTGAGNVAGGSIACGSEPVGSACAWTLLTGSTVTVVEKPGAAGSVFTGWGGACGGTNVSCTVDLSSDTSVSATWTSSTGLLLSASVSGSGTVSGGGISCPTTCAATQAVNSTVVLTTQAADGFSFTGWGGACSGTGLTCAVLMDAAKSVSATFAPVVPLSVTVNGNGNVRGEEGAINCGDNANVCTASLALNKTISLTATAATGSTFTGWSGACGGAAPTCTILMNGSKSVTATFTTGAALPLTVTVGGPGTVTGAGISCGNGATICGANATANASVALTATPAVGSTFTAWGGACSGAVKTCTLAMTSAKSVTATFAGGAASSVPLTVTVTGPGSVTGAGVNCGNAATACSANLTANASVTLTATPVSGATFTRWGGACTGVVTTCTLTMSAAKSVTATFGGPAAGTLAIAVDGRGTVSTSAGKCTGTGPRKTCTQHFATGRSVILSAAPATGSTFKGWAGACTGTKRTCTVSLSTASAVAATFSGSVATSVPVEDLKAAGDRLFVSQVRFSPSPIISRTAPITVRVRVTNVDGRWVRGARVFMRATPRVVRGDTRATGADGWVTLRLIPNQAFPEPRNDSRLQFFIKAYRAGDPSLGGIAGYRLVQVPLAAA